MRGEGRGSRGRGGGWRTPWCHKVGRDTHRHRHTQTQTHTHTWRGGYSLVPRGGQRQTDTHTHTHRYTRTRARRGAYSLVPQGGQARVHTHTPVLPLTLPVLPLAPPGRRRNCRRSWTGNATTVSQRPRPGRNTRRRRKGVRAGSQLCAGQARRVPGR